MYIWRLRKIPSKCISTYNVYLEIRKNPNEMHKYTYNVKLEIRENPAEMLQIMRTMIKNIYMERISSKKNIENKA